MLVFMLVLIGIGLSPNQTKVYALDLDFQVMPSVADWTSAQDICLLSQDILMPEFGNNLLKMEIFDRLNSEELWWMNAKNVVIGYGDALSVSLKFAYQPADFRLTSYLCYDEISGDSKRNVSCQPLTWEEAENVCQSAATSELLHVCTPDKLKSTVYLFQKDVPFWVDKMSELKLPSMISAALRMSEECWGVMKKLNGQLAYKKDNCSNRHKFICVSNTSDEQFAPTVTRMSRPRIKPTWNNTRTTTEYPGIGKATGSYFAFILLGVILILSALGVGYYLRRRWWKQKDLTGYIRSVSIRRLPDRTSSFQLQPRKEPRLEIMLWEREHQMDS